ncbi:ComF family protein [Candidatus Dojkabacteria bacterium]|uniref:ComF family protein n=1 Tax=Candidatus Dojkabacteria bacterium TaxID=2099670 RepID=A0A955LAH6_9BACT|nr:ComF family protein [Candidatus Dojkabacteria bacterium]
MRFTGITKNLLHELKYNYYFGLAEDVATLMIKTMDLSMLTDTTLVPIPLHWYKKNKRGFNQAELIAKHLVRLSKKSTRVIPLLTRVRNTKTQVGMKKEDRQQNLTNAFKVNPKLLKTIETDTVTLVDDVFTTGTTLEQCAQVLKEHGIKHVDAIVFARG